MTDPKAEVKSRLDIADIVGAYVQLKPAGSGSLKGLCPFHTERTPSFTVSRERQLFKCFGCDKGGDMFAFLMEIEGLTFREALEELAKRAGVELPKTYVGTPGKQDATERLLAINDAAARYYRAVLTQGVAGERARAYVATRHIPDALQEAFRLGAAPDAWDALTRALMAKGYTGPQLVEAGLSLKKRSGDGFVDRFRHRLMIPLCDAQGRVLGFTGRALPSSQPDAAKYMNSPETALYKKGSMLYGLHLAKAAARKAGEMILVEGNLDVVASHKAGVENVVGVSGTALTKEQLKLLSRYAPRIAFSLDADAAGFAAAKRAVDLAAELAKDGLPLSVRALQVPSHLGKDPDEIIQKQPQAWVEAAKSSVPVLEYVVTRTIEEFGKKNLRGVEARTALVDELAPLILRLSRPDEREYYLERIADASGASKAAIVMRIRQLADPTHATGEAKPPVATPAPKPTQPIKPTLQQQSADVLFAALLKDENLLPIVLGALPPALLTPPQQALYEGLKSMYTASDVHSPPPQQQSFFHRLLARLEHSGNTAPVPLLHGLAIQSDELFAGLSVQDFRREVEQHVRRFASDAKAAQKAYLAAAIREAERQGDRAKLQDLLSAYHALLGSG